MACRHVAVDVHYKGTRGVAAGIAFSSWESSVEDEQFVITMDGIADYNSGKFYLRELPCLEQLLRRVIRIPTPLKRLVCLLS